MSGEQGPVLLSDINDPLHQTRLLRLLQINTQQITNTHTHTEIHTNTKASGTHKHIRYTISHTIKHKCVQRQKNVGNSHCFIINQLVRGEKNKLRQNPSPASLFLFSSPSFPLIYTHAALLFPLISSSALLSLASMSFS